MPICPKPKLAMPTLATQLVGFYDEMNFFFQFTPLFVLPSKAPLSRAILDVNLARPTPL